ncbi:polycystin-1-like [Sphaerodactylus townsendi]|uniref:polycystin-1-like n=1 Tax=Sphaerodactylus townsendi TaxID=933632 RepID=UPI00202714A1|nr:polycystin-1-like [Sphaerodactylus townsendi]
MALLLSVIAAGGQAAVDENAFLSWIILPSSLHHPDTTSCPQTGLINLQNLNCYWISETKETWQKARKVCQEVPGGDLVVVRSLEIQTYLQNSFSSSAGLVWIGLSDLDSLGSLHWVDGYPVDPFQKQMPSGKSVGENEICVQMLLLDSKRPWRYNPCSGKSSFICEKRTGAALPTPNIFVTGIPVFSSSYNVKNISIRQETPSLAASSIELMLFPGLWFSHNGTVSSIDFGVQATKKPVHGRFQIYRPYCSPSQHLIPPGCELLQSSFACCYLELSCNTRGWCSNGHQWCPLKDHCLDISSPCSSYAFENTTGHLQFPHPPRYKGVPPFYAPVADLPLLLTPSSENTHFHVLLPKEDIIVYPDDIIGIQHDAGVGLFLQCLPHTHSPWRQSYISLVKDGWWEGSIVGFPSPTWVDSVLCDIRVTFAHKMKSLAYTSLLGPKLEPGLYTYAATVKNAVGSTQAHCAMQVPSKVSGLQLIYPIPVNGKLNVMTKQEILLVIKIRYCRYLVFLSAVCGG